VIAGSLGGRVAPRLRILVIVFARRSSLAALGVIAGVVLALVVGCGGSGSTAVGGGLLSKRQSAPDLSGTTLDGAHLDLASMRGKVVVVNFYAQWCGPCRAEAGALRNAHAATASAGVEFVGVLFQDSAVNGRTYLKDAGLTYPSLNDSGGVMLTKFKNVNARFIPDTFVIDRQGKVAARWIGPIEDEAKFISIVNGLAAEPA
jgi:peroxiredoxin